MFHLHPAEIPANKVIEIRKWLGLAPGRDLVEFLINKDAELSALAANKLMETADSEVEMAEVEELRDEALFHRKVIDLLAKFRKSDYKFEYQTVKPQPATTQPATGEQP